MKTKRTALCVLLAIFMAAFSMLLGIPNALAAGEVCEIAGGSQYMTLDEALAAAVDGDTIRLLADIDHNGTGITTSKTFTLDLNGFDLNVVSSGLGFSVNGGAVVSLTGAGNFNVTADNICVVAAGGSKATVTNATCTSIFQAARAEGGSEVTVRNNAVSLGSSTGYICAVYATDASSVVRVGGNASAADYGAYAYDGGVIRIDGTITASKYVCVQDEDKDGSPASRTVPTLLAGYHTYSSGNNIVYVKALPLAVVTNAVTNLTASSATLNGEVTEDGAAPVTDRGFVWGTAANPAIGDPGITQVPVGNGLGVFSSSLTSLATDVTYHVRAYAVGTSQAAGPITVYGEDVSFALSENPAPTPDPTPSPTPNDLDGMPQTGDSGGFPTWPGITGLALLGTGGLLMALRYKKKKV